MTFDCYVCRAKHRSLRKHLEHMCEKHGWARRDEPWKIPRSATVKKLIKQAKERGL